MRITWAISHELVWSEPVEGERAPKGVRASIRGTSNHLLLYLIPISTAPCMNGYSPAGLHKVYI